MSSRDAYAAQLRVTFDQIGESLDLSWLKRLFLANHTIYRFSLGAPLESGGVTTRDATNRSIK